MASLNALAPFQRIEDPTVSAFEKASSEQIAKEFKEELEARQKPMEEGVTLDEAPSVSLKREDFLGYGLDSLTKGLSPDALKKKREEEAKQRSKYISYAGDIFAETPVTNLNALAEADIAATQLDDDDVASLYDRPLLDRISLTEELDQVGEVDELGLPEQESLSWLEERYGEIKELYGKGKAAINVGQDVYDFVSPETPESIRQLTPEANLAALQYSGPYGAEYAATLTSSSQLLAAQAFDKAEGIWGLMGTQTGLAPFEAASTGQMIAANVSKYLPYALKAAALYSTFKGGIPKTTEGKVDAAISTYAIFTGNPVAIGYSIFKGLTAFLSSRRGKPKFAKGGADIDFRNNYFKATGGYGYNGYKKEAGQAGAAAISDYLNAFKDYFGVKFYAPAWKKAVRDDSRIGRYENINQSGYADPSALIRRIMEIPGFIQGAPKYNGQNITTQEQYEAAMGAFNKHYNKIAMQNGGLYNAEKAGVHQLSADNVPKQISFRKGTNTPDPNRPERDYYGRPLYYLVNTWSEDVDNPYDMLYYNLVGQFNRGAGGTGY